MLFTGPALAVTIAAVDRSARARLEGHLGLFAAFAAGNGKHLAGGGGEAGRRDPVPVCRMFRSAGSSLCPAGGTAFGWMVMSLCLKGLLLFNVEDISFAAIKTYE